MKSTFIGEIFLLDFKGRQVLYILTETKLDYIEDAVYHLQTTGFFFFTPVFFSLVIWGQFSH